MVNQYVIDLAHVLSADRLAPYRPSGGDDLAMIATYFWNVALCQALYASLGAAEVAIRNGLHDTLAQHFGQADWYDRPNLLLARELRDVASAKTNIVAAGKPVVPGRVVAALPFGFWTSLLDTAYGASPSGPQLWIATNGLLATAFPHATPYYSDHRRRVHVRVDSLRRLRNRVFHHEPVWNGVLLPSRRRKQPPRLAPLATLYTDIIETIGWVSPTLQATTTHLDTFPQVLAAGSSAIEAEIRAYIGP